MHASRIILATGAVAIIGYAIAQSGGTPVKPATTTKPVDIDTLYLDTKLGSFKSLDGNGKFSFSFTGTVLLSGVDGSHAVTGNVKKEFTSKDGKRIAYFGTGTIEVNGKWRGIQWFGRDMKGTLTGQAVIRLYGEFDKNLDTGFYWYKSAPKKQVWFTAGIDIRVPPYEYSKRTSPVRGGG